MEITEEKWDDLVQRIVQTAHPLRIILFGSHARGEANRHSDIDVLVVVPDGTHRRHTTHALYRAMLGFQIAVDVIVATPEILEAYKDSPGLVYREALRDGKELYAA